MKEPIPPPQDTIPSSSLSSLKQLRFLIIGAGSRGNAYARAVTTVTPGVIHAIAEPHAFKRRDFGRKYIWGAQESPREGQEFTDWREWVQWELERRKRATQNDENTADASTTPVGVDGVFICTLDETHVEILQTLAPLRTASSSEHPTNLACAVSTSNPPPPALPFNNPLLPPRLLGRKNNSMTPHRFLKRTPNKPRLRCLNI